MNIQEFKQWASEKGIGLIDTRDGIKVGDLVTFTNDYGVSFDNLTVIGIADDNYDFYGRKFFTDSDAYWFPKHINQLKKTNA